MAISNKPFAAEASYWEGCCFWHLAKAPEAVKAFERCMAIAEKNEEAVVWAKLSFDVALRLARENLKAADVERSLKWVENLERVYGQHKNNFYFAVDGVERLLNDGLAEVTFELAKKALAAKDLKQFKAYSERAFQLKHTTIGHDIAIHRAAFLKANKAKLLLTPTNITTIYSETLTAIDNMTTLTAAEKSKIRDEFNKQWKLNP